MQPRSTVVVAIGLAAAVGVVAHQGASAPPTVEVEAEAFGATCEAARARFRLPPPNPERLTGDYLEAMRAAPASPQLFLDRCREAGALPHAP